MVLVCVVFSEVTNAEGRKGLWGGRDGTPYLLAELCANMRLPGQNENRTRVTTQDSGITPEEMRPEVLRLRG